MTEDSKPSLDEIRQGDDALAEQSASIDTSGGGTSVASTDDEVYPEEYENS